MVIFDLLSSAASFGAGVASTVANAATNLTLDTVINKEVVSAFILALEKQPDFDAFLEALIPTIYRQICLRYLLPLICLIGGLFGIWFSLYYTGETARYTRYVMDLCDRTYVILKKGFAALVACFSSSVLNDGSFDGAMDHVNAHPIIRGNLRG